jgi:uncharacterized protein YkvS
VNDWKKIVDDDPDKAAELVRKYAQEGNLVEASNGLLAVIEAMSKSEENSAKSFLYLIALHLYKMWLLPHDTAVNHWIVEVEQFRDQVFKLLDVRPSMQNKLDSFVPHEVASAQRHVFMKLDMRPEHQPDKLSALTLNELLHKPIDDHLDEARTRYADLYYTRK